MKPIIYVAATVAALLAVLGTRVLIPALELVYYSVLQTFEPVEPEPELELEPTLALVSEPIEQRQAVSANQSNEDKAVATKPRTTRKRSARKTAAKSTAVTAVEALA